MAISRLPPRIARVLLFLAGVLLAAGLQAALFLMWDSGDPPPSSPPPLHAAGYRSA